MSATPASTVDGMLGRSAARLDTHRAVAVIGTTDELIAHATPILTGCEVLTSIRPVDELPRNPSGKMLERALRDDLERTDG